MRVLMQFGDGSFKEIDVAENEDPEVAVEQAADWVADNSWFEVQDVNGDTLAEERLR